MMAGFLNGRNQKAWVVFSGQTEIWWLRLLKPGFRHCYVLLNDGQKWISVDPLAHMTEVSVHHHLPMDFDLPEWLRERGNTVIAARDSVVPRRVAPCMLFTCVEAAKRILGIHDFWIWTPHDLYKHLTYGEK